MMLHQGRYLGRRLLSRPTVQVMTTDELTEQQRAEERRVLRRRGRLGLRPQRGHPAYRPRTRAGIVRVERRDGHDVLCRSGRGPHRSAADPAGDDLAAAAGRVPGLLGRRLSRPSTTDPGAGPGAGGPAGPVTWLAFMAVTRKPFQAGESAAESRRSSIQSRRPRVVPDRPVLAELGPQPRPARLRDPQVDHARRLQARDLPPVGAQRGLAAVPGLAAPRRARRQHRDDERLPHRVRRALRPCRDPSSGCLGGPAAR